VEQGRDVLGWLLVAAVGLAFADASVVVLALPSMYGEFGTSIVGVSWVLTAYALVTALVGLGLAAVHHRLRPTAVTIAGLVLFAAASIGCGVAPSQTVLVVARCLQGAGAALLLAGALPVLASLRGPRSGRTGWGLAATVGLAVGPALGGLLTQLFDWRVIFFVQVPVAAAALAVLADPRARRARTFPAARRPVLLPLVSLVFLSAALVGVLFLAVLLIIEVWRFSPLGGAAIVSVLPAGMLLVRPLATRLAPVLSVGGGALLLAGGLAVLALVPAAQVAWVVAALASCGAGLGLLSAVLDKAAVGPDGGVRDGSLAVGARQAGLVLGLLVIAPVLAGSLEQATERSMLAGTAAVLDARVPVTDKVRITLAVRDELTASPRGEMPDLEATVSRADVDREAARQVGRELDGRVTSVLTRSFRPAFWSAALLGLAVLLPGLLLVARLRRRRSRPLPVIALAVLVVGTSGVLLTEVAAGAADYGRYAELDGCTAGPDPYPGRGADAMLQRFALSTVNGAACELKVSRERMLLSLDAQGRLGSRPIARPDLERGVRAGIGRAADDAERRGDLPGWTVKLIREAAEHAPVDWLADRLGLHR
jgi:predicted MFS family arabinose efflux permease